MTAFRFIPVTPHPLLSPYVAKIWVFESAGRLPAQERKLIVPNANLKLTLTYRNGIAARVGAKAFLQRENELSLTGLIDTPVTLDPYEDVPEWWGVTFTGSAKKQDVSSDHRPGEGMVYSLSHLWR